jgi:hypothetical protein
MHRAVCAVRRLRTEKCKMWLRECSTAEMCDTSLIWYWVRVGDGSYTTQSYNTASVAGEGRGRGRIEMEYRKDYSTKELRSQVKLPTIYEQSG